MIVVGSRPELLVASCHLSEAEPYGDFLTYAPGHYETWQRWRGSRELSAPARAVVRAYEYEEWPRGRIVFDTINHQFVLYADRQLIGEARVEEICRQFDIPIFGTRVERDAHYRSSERLGS